MSPKNSDRGLTLLEVVIGLVVSGVLLVTLVRFFRDSHHTLSLQEQIAERNQTLLYLTKRLSDRIMEAGGNLPDTGWTVIRSVGVKDTIMVLGLNPAAGMQQFDVILGATDKVPVDDCNSFKGSDRVLIVYQDVNKPAALLSIKTSYSSNGFVNGYKDMTGAPDTLCFTQTPTFGSGDVLYSYAEEIYRLVNGEVYLGNMLLAENVDSVKTTFYNLTGGTATLWKNFRSAQLRVGARTAYVNSAIKDTDGRRHTAQTINLRLRNRQ
jgi:prepilin-type N-terminal cleavage/methylation domain-containing protein